MESSAQPIYPAQRPVAAGPGALVVLNGRQSGARRVLDVPVTFVGQSPGCALRLNVEGVDPLHCVLASGPEGVTIHDLDSARGTFVNGQRIRVALLRDGDLLDVGPFRFRVALTAAPIPAPVPVDPAVVEAAAQEREAVRIQAAAIVAQQAALDEDEARLVQRQAALQQQETRLAAHLKTQRSLLRDEAERHQAERRAWDDERAADEAELAATRAELERERAEVRAELERIGGHAKREATLAAQQAALDEDEVRLVRRQLALQQQETQLAARLEAQRGQLLNATERHQAERHAWQNDRATAEVELAAARADLERERAEVQAESERIGGREKRLADRAAKLEQLRAQLHDQKAAALTEIANGRAGVERLRAELEREREQVRAEERAGHARLAAAEGRLAERAAGLEMYKLHLREEQACLAVQQVQRNTQHELDSRLLQDGFDCLQADQGRWRERRKREGLTLRVRWLQVVEGERKLAETRRQLLAQCEAWNTQQRILEGELHGLNNRVLHQRQKLADQERELRIATIRPAEGKRPAGPPMDRALAARATELDRLAGELGDQRTQLVEQWERLARQQHAWQQQRDEAAAALETLAQRLALQEEALARRQIDADAAEDRLRHEQEAIERIRRETAGIHALLRVERQTWESERDQVLAESHRLGTLARRQLDGLAELRQKWNLRRRQETEGLRNSRRAVEQQRQELAQARLDLASEAQQLLDGERTAGGITAAPSVLRALRKQREWLKQDLAQFELVREELAQMAERMARTRVDLQEKQTALEYRESLLAANQAELEQTHEQSEGHRQDTERRLTLLQEETEHLARALLPIAGPAPALLERAA